jgi:hypothetical protein
MRPLQPDFTLVKKRWDRNNKQVLDMSPNNKTPPEQIAIYLLARGILENTTLIIEGWKQKNIIGIHSLIRANISLIASLNYIVKIPLERRKRAGEYIYYSILISKRYQVNRSSSSTSSASLEIKFVKFIISKLENLRLEYSRYLKKQKAFPILRSVPRYWHGPSENSFVKSEFPILYNSFYLKYSGDIHGNASNLLQRLREEQQYEYRHLPILDQNFLEPFSIEIINSMQAQITILESTFKCLWSFLNTSLLDQKPTLYKIKIIRQDLDLFTEQNF